MKILLLSNSSLPGQSYLGFAREVIIDFLKDSSKAAFIPYAAVTFSYDEYFDKVQEALDPEGVELVPIHKSSNPISLLATCDSVLVGGGNTFALLKRLMENQLFTQMKTMVQHGKPYIGWSAGSNLAGPTISTTNDMPITNPGTFESFGFVPFQINPHYIDVNPDGHMGETRDQRLEEFIEINQNTSVVAIPEGTYLSLVGEKLSYHGEKPGKIFKHGMEVEVFNPGDDLSSLTNN